MKAGKGSTPQSVASQLFPAISSELKRRFLLTYIHTGSVRKTARATQMDQHNHFNWMRSDPAYVEAYAEAQQMAATYLEDVAIERATAEEKPSDVLLIFLLKGMLPHKYKDTQRRDERTEISDLLKAVLLELVDRQAPTNVTPDAEWTPLPPAERPANGARGALPAPPDVEEER